MAWMRSGVQFSYAPQAQETGPFRGPVPRFVACRPLVRDAGAMVTAPTITPLDGPCFGAVVTDLDVRDLDHATFSDVYGAWLDHALLIFPGQHLDHDEQNTFARRFGELEFVAAPLSNVRRDGSLRPADGSDDMMQILLGNMGWHQDSTYMPVQAKGAVFSAEVVPTEGGATGFADTEAGYAALDDAVRAQITDRRASHSLYHSQAAMGHDGTVEQTQYSGYGFHDGPVSVRPLVKIHPETGAPLLTIGRHAYGIDGMADTESTALLQHLVDVTVRAPRVYHHQWTAGDVVVWDNRRLLHQATPWPFDQPRVMWHTRIAGDPATEAALAG